MVVTWSPVVAVGSSWALRLVCHTDRYSDTAATARRLAAATMCAATALGGTADGSMGTAVTLDPRRIGGTGAVNTIASFSANGAESSRRSTASGSASNSLRHERTPHNGRSVRDSASATAKGTDAV